MAVKRWPLLTVAPSGIAQLYRQTALMLYALLGLYKADLCWHFTAPSWLVQATTSTASPWHLSASAGQAHRSPMHLAGQNTEEGNEVDPISMRQNRS